jgi:hypothetical protein
MENQTKYGYIHLGIGSPGFRSYKLFLCMSFTSTCLHNHIKRSSIDTYVATKVDYVFDKFRYHIKELNESFHTYKSFDREYLVYKYSDKLYKLINRIFLLGDFINSHRVLKEKRGKIVNDIIAKCRDMDTCSELIENTIIKLENEIRKRRERGKKALLSRFENNTRKCKHIIDKYFSDLENAPTFKVSSIGFAECYEDAVKVLRKLFTEDISRRYANSICAGGNSIYIFARDSIIAIDARYDNHDVRIFYDSCRDTPSYAIVKLIGASLVNGYIDRIDWIAVLGYDKNTNQVFLHYVPRTLLFKDVETCRLWILGLTDRYGNPIEDVELIEV